MNITIHAGYWGESSQPGCATTVKAAGRFGFGRRKAFGAKDEVFQFFGSRHRGFTLSFEWFYGVKMKVFLS